MAKVPKALTESGMSTSSSALSESEILADVLASDEGDLTSDTARSILRWRFSEEATTRISRLAERNQKGTISSEEREQLDQFLRVGTLINLLQAKARRSLAVTDQNGT